MCCSSKRRVAALKAAQQAIPASTLTPRTSADTTRSNLTLGPDAALNNVNAEVLVKAGIPPPSYKESTQVQRAVVPSEPEPPVLRKQVSAEQASIGGSELEASRSLASSLSGLTLGGLEKSGLTERYERKLAKLQRKMLKKAARFEERAERAESKKLQREARMARRGQGCCC